MLTIIVAFSFLIIIALLLRNSLCKVQANGLADFQKKHPKSFKGGKFNACPHCSANDIISRQVSQELGMVMKAHCCAACGHELWRSKSRI